MERQLQKSPLANKDSNNSCLESMYMYPRRSAHTAKEVTSWTTNHKHLRFAQGLENSFTGGFSRTVCFYDGRYSRFSLQPRYLHTLQAFVSHFLSTYKYILEPFRPSLGIEPTTLASCSTVWATGTPKESCAVSPKNHSHTVPLTTT